MGIIARVSRWLFVEQSPQPADIILIAGSPYPEPARRAAQLYSQGYAPVVLPSGSRWLFHTSNRANEWQAMRDELLAAGVPQEAILREDRARHTVDNARMSAQVCREYGIAVHGDTVLPGLS